MNNKLRALVLLPVLMIAVLLMGCSGTVTVAKSEYSGSNYSYEISINIPKETVELLENGTGGDDGDNKETVSTADVVTRSVKEYMKQLSELCGVDIYEHDYKNGAYSYKAQIIADQELFANPPPSSEWKKQKGLFFNTYTVTMRNPFAEAFELYGKGKPTYQSKDSLDYIVYLISAGSKDDCLLPFHEYFSVDKKIADGVVFEFLLQRRMLMQADADIKIFNESDYFCFSSSVADTDGIVTYTFKSVNSYVWYITFILLGAIVATVLYLVARKRKTQPALNDETELEKKRLAFKKMRSQGGHGMTPPSNPSLRRDADPFGKDNTEKSVDPFDEEK